MLKSPNLKNCEKETMTKASQIRYEFERFKKSFDILSQNWCLSSLKNGNSAKKDEDGHIKKSICETNQGFISHDRKTEQAQSIKLTTMNS